MQLRYSMALGTAVALGATPLLAADLQLKVEIPRLSVAEYHRPYVAVWIEKADQSLAGNLAVWYEVKNKNNEGTKWLKDMRAWWRKTGRDLTLPADGLSSATRAPGEHSVNFAGSKTPLDSARRRLPAGGGSRREVGGRELVKVPFTWPPKAATTTSAKGEHDSAPSQSP